MPEQASLPPDKKRDRQYLFRGVIYALLITGIYYAFLPYMGGRNVSVTDEQVTTFSTQIKPMLATEVGHAITTSKKPTMLVVYASWCNYCRRVSPTLKQLWSTGAFDGLNMVYVSLDHDAYSLANYLLKKDLHDMVGTPRIYKNVGPALPEVLKPLGSSFTGGIPYIAYFKPGGRMVHESLGMVYKNAITSSIEKLKTP